ncbi:MAG: respiratory nitrate reductase subunit gamma [Nitrososphaerota archaeon]
MYRYDANQLSWTSKSSELLEKRLLTIGSMLFHVGILLVFAGHVFGLLIPIQVYTALGISPETYHAFAIIGGGGAGLMAFVGISILLYRRIFNARVRRTSDVSDYVADGLLWVVILLGMLVTWGYNLLNGAYEYRTSVGPWIRSVLVFQPNAALMTDVPLILQIHIAATLLLLAVSPFTRLIHAYSAPIAYLTRAPLQYRARYGFGSARVTRLGERPVPAIPSTPPSTPPRAPVGSEPEVEVEVEGAGNERIKEGKEGVAPTHSSHR